MAKALSKSQIAASIAEKSGITKKQATEILDSTTWEEANSRTLNWVRQRSRWIKGYFQTHLVHTRDSWLPSLGMAFFCGWLIWK